VNKYLVPAVLATLVAIAAVPVSAQISTGGLTNYDRAVYNLAEAYPCTVGTYDSSLGIALPQIFTGVGAAQPAAPAAAPGTFCLARKGFSLDINCFAVTPTGEFNCVVQAYRLFKMVPGSFKCPDVYGLPHFDDKGNLLPYTYAQFGSGIRTWWSLSFTQPGTRFLLQVVSACQFIPRDALGNPVGVQRTHIHVDSWRWRVIADQHTLANLIEVMHGAAVSTLEAPCILGEDMYDSLNTAQQKLASAIAETSGSRLYDIENAIFDMEALIVSNCLFVEVLNPLLAFPGPSQFGAPNIQPPGNLAQSVIYGNQGSAVAGIIDTIEHPCCCKLLVDLEWIAIKNGSVGQTPTLPTF
jgi:hypothetical protein